MRRALGPDSSGRSSPGGLRVCSCPPHCQGPGVPRSRGSPAQRGQRCSERHGGAGAGSRHGGGCGKAQRPPLVPGRAAAPARCGRLKPGPAVPGPRMFLEAGGPDWG